MLSFTKIIAQPLIHFVRYLECYKAQFKGFDPKTSIWEGVQPNLFLAFSQTSKQSVDFKLILNFEISSMDFFLRITGDGVVLWIRPCLKKSFPTEVEHQNYGQLFSRLRRCCVLVGRSAESNCQSEVTLIQKSWLIKYFPGIYSIKRTLPYFEHWQSFDYQKEFSFKTILTNDNRFYQDSDWLWLCPNIKKKFNGIVWSQAIFHQQKLALTADISWQWRVKKWRWEQRFLSTRRFHTSPTITHTP